MKHFRKGSSPRNLDQRRTNDLFAKVAPYREKNRDAALFLLDKLFHQAPSLSPAVVEQGTCRILVIGAGSFPSFVPFITALKKKYPDITHLDFCLVEPMAALTALFLQHFSHCPLSAVTVKITVDLRDSQAFLQQEQQRVFDIVYFEHPDVMTLPIVLARLGLRRYHYCSLLRESIPYIANVIKPTGFILASCMSKHEVKQLRALLAFSGHRPAHLVASLRLSHFFYGGPFTSGLYCAARRLPTGLPQQAIARAIRQSDHYLCVALLLSFIVYIIYCIPAGPLARALSVLLMVAQLWLHRPGHRGLMMKFFLMVGQIVLV